MEMDLKKIKEDYDKYPFEEKKETVTSMLEALLWEGDNFDSIYNFIIHYPEQVSESDLNEVFWILLLSMYQDNQHKLKDAELKLDIVRKKMMKIQQIEQQEKQADNPDYFMDNALNNF